MSTFGGTVDAGKVDTAAGQQIGSAPVKLGAMGIAGRNFVLVTASGVVCALLAYGACKLATPRYVATAQVYVDPSAAQGSDASSGSVSYVESQILIATSRSMLERVVTAQKLDRDPEFAPTAGGSFFGPSMPADGAEEDTLAATARALGDHLQVERLERTLVLDLSVSSRDPARAAELANAIAQAYVDEVDAIHSDAGRQTGAAIAGRLETLRARVLEAEKSVEDYKVANGLVGIRDTLLVEQQLKELNDQIVSARERMSEARARADQIETARRKGGDVGAIASQLDLTSLGPLREQQAEARKKFAAATAEFGPRHPQIVDAQARMHAADAAVDAELARLAESQRTDYARAKALETSLTRQFDDLQRQTNADDPSMIGLRDLERKAKAARDVYELSVDRPRDTGETQQVGPSRTKIITVAAPPNTRAFPPSSFLVAGAGFVLGLGLGLLVAVRREGGRSLTPVAPAQVAVEPAPAAPLLSEAAPSPSLAPPPPTLQEPPQLTVGASTRLRTRTRRQSLERLDLIDLGFPALPDSADADEFVAVLKAVDFVNPRTRDLPGAGSRRRFVLVVAGSNDYGDRTALAINLAVTAARGGARVVLLDAAGRNAKLTRAVRSASRKPILDAGAIYETENGVRLALPKASGAERGRQRPEAMLRQLLDARDETLDLIVCDGPGASEVEAASVFEYANAIVALDGAEEATTLEQLADLGFAPSVLVRFDMCDEALRRSA
jgi:uncharacterized protein involved in exopolysaccharide biosynthesis/Mrp family chromosome partitioning ATPase